MISFFHLSSYAQRSVPSLKRTRFAAALLCAGIVSFSVSGQAAFGDQELLDTIHLSPALAKLMKNAEEGNALSQYTIGCMCYEGIPIPKNISEATKWLELSLEKGSIEDSFLSEFDIKSGEELSSLIKAVVARCVEATRNANEILGRIYEVTDKEKAIKYFTEAAERGHLDAQAHLGQMFYTGKSIERNLDQAASWLTQAAQQGHVESQNILNSLYSENPVFSESRNAILLLPIPENKVASTSYITLAKELRVEKETATQAKQRLEKLKYDIEKLEKKLEDDKEVLEKTYQKVAKLEKKSVRNRSKNLRHINT